MRPHPTTASVAVRRRIAMRFGLAGVVLLSLVMGATACIFEKSDYKGGGRLDKGATASTADVDSSLPEPDPVDAAGGG